jgi:hypothetical protein
MLKLFYAFVTLFFVSCAIISSPEGGEKDLIAPEVIKTRPENKSVNFNSNVIEIEFDEYIELQNFGTQFYASPPLQNKITQKLKGKKLSLTLSEELLPNTTYTFNFGNCITDITERNVQANFKYVFSTGPYLDSLSVSGQVVDAYTGLPEEGLIALLYPFNISDSAILSTKPIYYAVTNKEGSFSIENLALDTFQLFAVKDQNFDLTYTHGAEKYGFAEHSVISGIPEYHEVRTFFEKGGLKLMEASQKSYGSLQLSFNKPPLNLKVEIVENDAVASVPNQNFMESDFNGDTVYYWYNPKQYPEDLNFFFVNVDADSLHVDSVRVLLKKLPPTEFKISFKTEGKVGPKKPLTLESTTPITAWNKELIALYFGEEEVPFEMAQIDDRHFSLNYPRNYGETHKLIATPGAFKDLFNTKNDSIKLTVAVGKEEDLAILQLKVSSLDGKNKILQLYNLKRKTIIEERPFTYRLDFELRNLSPESYGLRVIWDDNNNGKWDAGEFIGRKQPEQVLYYPKAIELRANWELETVWEIPSK